MRFERQDCWRRSRAAPAPHSERVSPTSAQARVMAYLALSLITRRGCARTTRNAGNSPARSPPSDPRRRTYWWRLEASVITKARCAGAGHRVHERGAGAEVDLRGLARVELLPVSGFGRQQTADVGHKPGARWVDAGPAVRGLQRGVDRCARDALLDPGDELLAVLLRRRHRAAGQARATQAAAMVVSSGSGLLCSSQPSCSVATRRH